MEPALADAASLNLEEEESEDRQEVEGLSLFVRSAIVSRAKSKSVATSLIFASGNFALV